MWILRIASISFFIVVLVFSVLTSRLFRWQEKGILYPDIAFPLLLAGYVLIADRAGWTDEWARLLLCLAILGFGLLGYLLLARKEFILSTFWKFYRRAGFLGMLLLYLALIVRLFL